MKALAQAVPAAANPRGRGARQTRLAVGASLDPLEREADRVADQVLSNTPHSTLGGTPLRIQRFAPATPGRREQAPAPASVEHALSGSGHPLEPGLRADMELRFGHDFSRVRVHDDAAAEQSARELRAQAYTVGERVVFGAGRFAPGTHEGRRLLAHELAHVVQQAGGEATTLHRKVDVGDFDVGDFDLPTLQAYLAKFGPNNIEDNSDSDDKARTIARLWSQGKIALDASKKILLIQEMQSGFTGNDDERAILTLLQGSDNADLSLMFGGSGLGAEDLLSDFHGDEEDLLLAFYDARFDGGSAKALAGSTKLKARVESFGSEKVEIVDAADAAEVRRIIKDIKDKYGIDLNSDKGVAALKARYNLVPQSERDGLKTREWHLDELHAMERALKHYETILGPNRASSTRAGAAQEVTTVAKNEQSIDSNTPDAPGVTGGRLDTTTMGEYFGTETLFGLYKAAEGKSGDFPGDVPKQLEATIVHEIAHGVFAYRLGAFVSRFKYWKDATARDAVPDTPTSKTRIANKNVEAPISFYGTTNAGEDLAESAMFFFVAPKTLKEGNGTPIPPKKTPGNPCPERFKFIEETVKDWKPKPKAAPKGKKP